MEIISAKEARQNFIDDCRASNEKYFDYLSNFVAERIAIESKNGTECEVVADNRLIHRKVVDGVVALLRDRGYEVNVSNSSLAIIHIKWRYAK